MRRRVVPWHGRDHDPDGPDPISRYRELLVVFDGSGSPLTTGIKGDVSLDFQAEILSWVLLADQTGSIVVDIWKVAYASYPATVTNTITASAKPTLSSVDHNESSTLTGWTTLISAGDTLRFHIDSISTVTRVTLALNLQEVG